MHAVKLLAREKLVIYGRRSISIKEKIRCPTVESKQGYWLFLFSPVLQSVAHHHKRLESCSRTVSTVFSFEI
jgi:hypothetical protein